ncbi:DUF6922 domain-containing protein [Flavobacterium seoulense]|uniref:Plasmid maintenance system antidote protein n=1 Tax=Flavobacterium seoulense TaxID=1492738 RepID=A0A066WSU0_9FLAO|nr:hypothetical protein [Flavobacterium seoulense]KDN55648.1 plasmid maintenance system antidote protein [Flavobacterium seoulense]
MEESKLDKIKSRTFFIDLPTLRPVLFWDTKKSTIDWEKHKKAIIKRVFERGNEMKKKEIIRFYGSEMVDMILKKSISK